jgi:mannose-1-phosphate guanylyltransferase
LRFIVAEQLRAAAVKADIVLEPTRRPWQSLSARRLSANAIQKHWFWCWPPTTSCVIRMRSKTRVERQPKPTEGLIVTFGLTSTFPAKNYGCIRPGVKLNGGAAFSVEAFVEKPDAETAATYVNEKFLWNSGNFAFRSDIMLCQ